MALYDDASFIFLASGAAGLETKDASKVYNVKPAPITTGSELVTNGGFDTDSDWTKSGEATISGGKGNIISSTGTYAALNQSSVFVIGKKYKISLDVTVNTNEHSFAIKLQDGAVDANIGKVTTSGSYVFYHTAAATTLTIARFSLNDGSGGNSATDVDVDNVSVFEVDVVPADFDISRGSNLGATRVGPTGLIEKGRENLVHYSNNFATASGGGGWGHNGINNLFTGQDGYDGTTNATLLTASTASQKHQIQLGVAQSLPGTDFSITGVFTLSVHAKPNGYDHLILRSDVANIDASFNIATGVVGTKGSKCIASSMTDAGNGFYRCQATFSHSGSVTFLAIGMMEADDTTDFTGDTSKGYILQDAQLEVGLVATELIPTSGAAATAGVKEDEARFDFTNGGPCRILQEPTRQNNFAHSEYMAGTFNTIKSTFTANAATSPEGVQNATSVLETATSGTHGFRKLDIDIDLGTFYSISFFVKANGREKFFVQHSDETVLAMSVAVDLSGTPSAVDNRAGHTGTEEIINYGNGWYRVEINGKEGLANNDTENLNFFFIEDASGTTTSYTGDTSKGLLFYGLQIEGGTSNTNKYCTSYIPCHGVATERTGDTLILGKSGATLQDGGFITSSAGTLFIDTPANGYGVATHVHWDLKHVTNGHHRIRIYFQSETSVAIRQTDSDQVQTALLTVTGLPANGQRKVAVAWNGTSVKVGINGVYYDSTTTPAVSAMDSDIAADLQVITRANNTGMQCDVNSIVLFNSQLTQSQLESLTAL